MTEQAETGDVGRGANEAALGQLGADRVDPRHEFDGRAARARLVRPRLIPVVAMPVPSGFVRTRRSPGLAFAFVSIFFGETIPVTASP